MRSPTTPWLVALAAAAALSVIAAGCGRGTDHAPDLAKLPLVSGARIITQSRTCDPGANADCAYDLVVTNSRYRSADQFLAGERQELHRLGWTGAYAPNGDEHAVDSPGGKLHLVYATADRDLKGIDLGWIQRTRPVALALSRAIFEHSPTLSMQLALGDS